MATEKRLIDANALLKAIEFEYDLNYGEILTDPVRFAYMVEDAPTVDAVEVVRCKNCQKHEPCEVRNRVWCRQMGRYMREDGFCSEGKVKEDG